MYENYPAIQRIYNRVQVSMTNLSKILSICTDLPKPRLSVKVINGFTIYDTKHSVHSCLDFIGLIILKRLFTDQSQYLYVLTRNYNKNDLQSINREIVEYDVQLSVE